MIISQCWGFHPNFLGSTRVRQICDEVTAENEAYFVSRSVPSPLEISLRIFAPFSSHSTGQSQVFIPIGHDTSTRAFYLSY